MIEIEQSDRFFGELTNHHWSTHTFRTDQRWKGLIKRDFQFFCAKFNNFNVHKKDDVSFGLSFEINFSESHKLFTTYPTLIMFIFSTWLDTVFMNNIQRI